MNSTCQMKREVIPAKQGEVLSKDDGVPLHSGDATMAIIGVQRSKADVCLFFQWTSMGMLVCLSWVDDILIAGSKESVLRVKANLRQHFTLDQQGELCEYVGCKIERDKTARWMKSTQPVMIQSFTDEFDLSNERSHTSASD
jgi:hypothetical protein